MDLLLEYLLLQGLVLGAELFHLVLALFHLLLELEQTHLFVNLASSLVLVHLLQETVLDC